MAQRRSSRDPSTRSPQHDQAQDSDHGGRGCALASAAAIPALSGAQVPGRDITVLEKVQSVRFVHVSRTAPGTRTALGDRVITRQAMFDTGRHPSGTLYTDCVAVGPPASLFKATLQCTATFRFADGQVMIEGVNRIGGTAPVAITGGSGAYEGAHGQLTSGAPLKGFDTVDVLHLEG
jgi:hypothetical protein